MITVDGSAFRQSLGALSLDLDRAAADALEDAVREAEQHAFATRLFNDQTQRLRSSTKGTIDRGKLTARLRNATKYAAYVEEGTRPHEIRARRARVLAFQVGGQTVYRARVMHPGTKPRPFMRQAGEVGTTVLERSLHANVDHAITHSNAA